MQIQRERQTKDKDYPLVDRRKRIRRDTLHNETSKREIVKK